MWELDHLAITSANLDEGTNWVESALGVSLMPGGTHARYGTHNRLLSLGPGLYLEVIAPDPDAPQPPHPRWFGLDHAGPPRLSNWILRVPDLATALAASPPESGVPTPLARGDLAWTIAVPPDGSLPHQGGWPTLIQWTAGRHPAERLPDAGIRLTRLEIHHPYATALTHDLAPFLADKRIILIQSPTPALRAAFAASGSERWLG